MRNHRRTKTNEGKEKKNLRKLQLGQRSQGSREEEQKEITAGGAPSYCGRTFRMAFTSSATAVRANSN